MVTPTGRQLCQGGSDLRVVLDIAGDPKGLFPLLPNEKPPVWF